METRRIVIDCAGLGSEEEFWRKYLAVAKPEYAESFGCNLDAFWDAVDGGGPGWPGENCELRFVNTAPLEAWRDGYFLRAIREIARDAKHVRIVVEPPPGQNSG